MSNSQVSEACTYALRLRDGFRSRLLQMRASKTAGDVVQLIDNHDGTERVNCEALDLNFDGLDPWILDGEIVHPEVEPLKDAFVNLDEDGQLSGAAANPGLKAKWAEVEA